MGVPALRTPQINFLGYAQGMDRKKRLDSTQNYLDKKRDFEEKYRIEDRLWTTKQRGYQREGAAITAAKGAGSIEEANDIYKRMGGTSKTGITFKGEDISFDYPEFSVTGSPEIIGEFAAQIEKDPTWADKPESYQWMAKNGVSFTEKEQKDGRTTAIKDYEYGKNNPGFVAAQGKDAPKTRTIQRGRNNIAQEWNGSEWVQVGSGPKDKDATGMEITTADGTTIRTGVKHDGKLTRGTETGVQKTLLEANSTYSDLKNTLRKYDDKYLKGREKLGFYTDAFKEKWDIGNVSLDERKELRDYTKFRRDAISSLNNYIKQITGAAMSAQEATRLMKGMPSPGIGLFDGDSPTEFKANMSGVMESLDRVIARNNYVKNHGLKSFKDVGLEQIDGIIDQRGRELEAEIRASNADKSDQEIDYIVIDELTREFGIRF